MPKDPTRDPIIQLNLKKVDELTQPGRIQKWLTIAGKSLLLAFEGLGVGGAIVAGLATIGIVGAAIEIAGAAAGAAVLGGLGFAIGFYKAYKNRQAIKKGKANFDHELDTLRKSIIDALNEYQLLNELKDSLTGQIKKLRELTLDDYEVYEREKIEGEITKLVTSSNQLDEAMKEITEHLSAMLSLVAITDKETSDTTPIVDRLNVLFPGSELLETKILGHAQKIGTKPEDQNRVKVAMGSLLPSLPASGAINTGYQTNLSNSITTAKPKITRGEKVGEGLMQGVAFSLGLFGGFGSTLGIAALILGGAAALAAAPVLPFILGAAALVGIGLGVASVLYTRKIEKEHLHKVERINQSRNQVVGMNKYVRNHCMKQELRNTAKSDLAKGDLVAQSPTRLDRLEKNFEKYISRVDKHVGDIEQLHKTTSHFHVTTIDRKEEKRIVSDIQDNVVEMKVLKKQVASEKTSEGNQEKKNRLLATIEMAIQREEQNNQRLAKIHQTIDSALHPEQRPKPTVVETPSEKPRTATAKEEKEENEKVSEEVKPSSH